MTQEKEKKQTKSNRTFMGFYGVFVRVYIARLQLFGYEHSDFVAIGQVS